MAEVKINIVSERGHDTLMLESQQALERIQHETQNCGKWCYIDGKFVKSETLTAEQLQMGENITLVNALAGG